jgi:hypothetical protein
MFRRNEKELLETARGEAWASRSPSQPFLVPAEETGGVVQLPFLHYESFAR